MSNVFTEYLGYGLSVIPVRDKMPTIQSWKEYQTTPVSAPIAAKWGIEGGIACICGKVSGGLVCVDFDVKNGNQFDNWTRLVTEQYPEILSKVVIENTPSGGYHVVFRTDKPIKNLKLAHNKDRLATIETRGEGGYFVCAPTSGYSLYFGEFGNIARLTEDETEILLSVAASLSEYHEERQNITKPPEMAREGDITPFDDYDHRHDLIGLLASHGWTLQFKRGETVYFQRPGKKGRGISATWNAVPDRFYVFSTSTQFENNHVYKPSAVYAILEHGGDYSAAAKALYSKGYGKISDSPVPKIKVVAKVIDTADMRSKILDIHENGYRRGTSTGWKNLDALYSVIKGQFTVVTGMPSHGKSEFMDALMLNLALLDDWRFGVFAPENYPTEMHYHKLIEKCVGKPMTHGNKMTVEEIDISLKFIDQHFYFIDATEEEINLEAILAEAQNLINTKKIDGLCLDPWNEIELDKPKDQSSTEFIGKCLRIGRKFARRNNIHLWIVAHPIKMQKDKSGEYPVPELYDIEGSAHWRNKADNGICIHRNFEDKTTNVIVQKIKYRYTGKPGLAKMRYDEDCGRYYSVDSDPYECGWGNN